jgi:uncharacterized protein (TIGR03435 family)
MNIFRTFALCSLPSALCSLLFALCSPLCMPRLAVAQTASPAFEVISVKPNKSGEAGARVGMSPNGRFQATNVTLLALIRNAYNVRPFQISGGPNWIDSDHFDITAIVGRDLKEFKPSPDGPPAELVQMVKNLLAERFKVVVHTETRDAPIYNLVFAREDHRLGEKIKSSDVDCNALFLRGGAPPAVKPGDIGPCGIRIGTGRLSARSAPMTQLARNVAALVQRQIVDKTGLAGGYDLDLEWTPESAADLAGASIFTAFPEQLGLKLEAARGPVEMLVIDHAEEPTAD